MVATKHKNQLIQYKGGGFDGCFWEWNFCHYDENGKWQDIFSSGVNGCKDESNTLEMIEENNSGTYIYDLRDKESIAEFENENNAKAVKGVYQHLNNAGIGYPIEEKGYKPFKMKCGICGIRIDPDYVTLEDWHGIGGIASQPESAICEECLSEHTCIECGEFYQKELDYQYCEYCFKEVMKKCMSIYQDDTDFVFLEYNETKNSYVPYEEWDMDTDDIVEGKLFIVTAKMISPIGTKNYILFSSGVNEAIEDIALYLDNQHASMHAEKIKLDSLLELA